LSAQRLLDVLRERGLTLAVAEGDTGGLVLELLTANPGSSAVVLGGVVAYHDGLKQTLLGVSTELFAAHGSVSQEVAEAMAHGVLDATSADVGIAATGIAGPGGATATKPVGLTWLAVTDGQRTQTRQHHWQGNRAHNRQASAQALFDLALEFLQG
jgi:PncC family amidohydrolase